MRRELQLSYKRIEADNRRSLSIIIDARGSDDVDQSNERSLEADVDEEKFS
jgi:hypothetical protein